MHEDWLARWREGRIAFHEGRPNDLLVRHVERLAGRRRVLVPLCGKTEDLAFLAARGHDVVGVELAEQAVRAFFAEHGLVPTVEPRGELVEYRAEVPNGGHGRSTIALLAGDVFAIAPGVIGPIDAVYDRAALIALPPEARTRYVALVRGAVPPGTPALVVTLEYDQRRMNGPPFSVLESELRALYAGATVELLEERLDTGIAKCAQAGIPATERCFAIGAGDARS